MIDDLTTSTRELVRRMAPDPSGYIDDKQRLVEDLGFDSIRLVELTIALERRFSLPRQKPDNLVDVRRVEDVIHLVRCELRGASADE